jgi:hypothetical protein
VRTAAEVFWASLPTRVKSIVKKGWKGGPIFKLADEVGWMVTEDDLVRNFIPLRVFQS